MPVGGPQRGPSGGAPPRRPKGRVECTLEGPRESASVAAESDPFDIELFKQGLDLKILESSEERIVLQLRGCDASLANALRRILISEVPTVALETIQACGAPMWQNTGVIQDEVLAHRLGLVPFRVNPDKLKFRSSTQELGEENSLKMRLHVKCTAADLQPFQKSMPVYAKDLKWIPLSERQKAKFADDPPVPVHPDILITKLRPVFIEPIQGEEAEELKSLCPMGVFDVEEAGELIFKPPF
ncbi:hypothetical protein Emag_002075 [Eimeria magna]